MSGIERIKEQADIAQLAGEYVELKRTGPGRFTGLCPFHEEKTPSFTVYPEHFHCYGCGAHGDAIDFYQRIEGLTPGRAIGQLAERYGISDDANAPRPARAQFTEEERAAGQIYRTGLLLRLNEQLDEEKQPFLDDEEFDGELIGALTRLEAHVKSWTDRQCAEQYLAARKRNPEAVQELIAEELAWQRTITLLIWGGRNGSQELAA